MGLAQMAGDNFEASVVETKFGNCQVGSMLSYKVGFTESTLKATADISSVPRQQVARQQPLNYPRFPLRNEDAMVIPEDITDEEEKALDNLMVDENKVNEIERETQQ